MRRRNREINIFNMSALDLFASALGAFILLFAILMPYYLKTSKIVMQENVQLKTQVNECQAQVTNLQSQVQSLQQSLEDRVKFALLGINTKAQSFVLVVDMSGSMKDYTETMKNTVTRILEPFEAKHKVQIFGFREDQNNGVDFENWQSPYNLVEMTDVNKQAVKTFANNLAGKFDGGTPTKDALLEALKYEAGGVILLTDGAPTKGGQASDPLDIINTVTAQNVGKKEIHTVAIGDYNAQPDLVDFLQKLAAENGGAFVGAAK